LHANVHPPSEPKIVGTEFVLDGCTDKDIEQAKDLFLRFSGETIIEETQYGQALEKKEDVARIYVNGVKVAEEDNFIFSYNITSLNQAIRKALNRERTNVGRTVCSGRVKSILLSCKNKNVAKELVNDLKNYQVGTTHDELKWIDVSVHACKLLNSFEKVVFFTSDELIYATGMVDRAKNDGYEIVTIPENIREKIRGQVDSSGNIIRDLEQFNIEWNERFEFKFVDEKDFSPRELTNFQRTKDIMDFIGGMPKNVMEIRISETMRLDTHSFTEAVGLWESSKKRIIIKRDQLKSLQKYAGTLLHEVGHALSGASDVSRTFEQHLTFLMGIIIETILE